MKLLTYSATSGPDPSVLQIKIDDEITGNSNAPEVQLEIEVIGTQYWIPTARINRNHARKIVDHLTRVFALEKKA